MSIIKLIGLSNWRRIGIFLGLFCYYLIPIRKKTVIENLKKAFPEKSNKEIKTITRGTYKNIFITFIELIYFPVSSKEEIEKLFEVDDERKALVEKLYDKKKGLMFLSAHFGSWEVGALSAALQLNQPFFVLAQKQSSDFFTKWLIKAREVHGNKTIWIGKSVRHIYEALKQGEIVGIVGDQRGPKESLRVNFFNSPTSLHPGTAYFIIKTECNVIVGFAVRKKDKNYTAIFEKLDTDNLPANQDEAIRELNQRYIIILEKYVRQYPDQYFWMHKIWKY